jgi:hypothetical protein
VLAVAEFRRAGLFEVHIGPGTRLRVAVKQSEATHELQFGKLEEWLTGGARSPNEQVTKARPGCGRCWPAGKRGKRVLARAFTRFVEIAVRNRSCAAGKGLSVMGLSRIALDFSRILRRVG